jgi:hypothetical protein
MNKRYMRNFSLKENGRTAFTTFNFRFGGKNDR